MSTLVKHNFGLGFQTELSNGLRINSTFNYVNNDRVAPPTSDSFSSNPTAGEASIFSNIFYTPRSVDVNGLPFENPQDGSSIYYRGNNSIQHPNWTLANTADDEAVRRFFGQISLSYPITSWLSANYRIGLDGYTQRKRFHVNKGGRQIPLGLLRTSERENFIQDHNLNLQYNSSLNENITLDGVIGLNVRRDNFYRTTTTSEQQFVFGLIDHENFISHNSDAVQIDENLIGAY
ncbi:MAG: SusC/RagA family TonB-linked outer membrane protein, partial [Bacteroidota bacterium]